LGRVLGLYKEMADAGQVELTTSPYYHPILPLLVDMESARMAMPGVALPARKPRYPEDAETQVARGIALHQAVFERPPRGMWPPEGSVCAAVVPLAAKAGIRWMATDEGILGHSLGIDLTRDGAERLVMPHVLYKPYRFEHEGAEVSLIFRDRLLSDLIGFRYQRRGAREAAGDFLERLGKIRASHPCEELLVPVVLDGENPWEGYPGGGVEFLKSLYGRLAETDWIRTTTPSEFLDTHPDRPRLQRLHAGSWIDSNFSIWIGGRDGNRAWERLDRTRDDFLREAPTADPAAAAKAREAILAAEGSDWFWWFSNRFTSDEDENFDGLFRSHLANAYRFLGRNPPEDLQSPILQRVRKPFTQPVNLLAVVLDGETTHFFEWRGAGEYDPALDFTSMGRSREKGVTGIRLGADRAALLLRVDFDPTAASFLADGSDVRITGLPGKRTAVLKRAPGALEGEVALSVREAPEAVPSGGRWAARRVLELSLPFAALDVRPGESFGFQLETVQRGRVLDRFPRNGVFEITAPGRDFDLEHWVV
ncbi:MAG: glycoside hydrolase family 57 protein, partial [Planctomycetes bacterium]|nr:glycoside hydrolase family 57 protein [Planctomycetota bacterium]